MRRNRFFVMSCWWVDNRGVLQKSVGTPYANRSCPDGNTIWMVTDIESCVAMIMHLKKDYAAIVKKGEIAKIFQLYNITRSEYFQSAVKLAARGK